MVLQQFSSLSVAPSVFGIAVLSPNLNKIKQNPPPDFPLQLLSHLFFSFYSKFLESAMLTLQLHSSYPFLHLLFSGFIPSSPPKPPLSKSPVNCFQYPFSSD